MMLDIMRKVYDPSLRNELLNLPDDDLVNIYNKFCYETDQKEYMIFDNKLESSFNIFEDRRDLVFAIHYSQDDYNPNHKWFMIEYASEWFPQTTLCSFDTSEDIRYQMDIEGIVNWLCEIEMTVKGVLGYYDIS